MKSDRFLNFQRLKPGFLCVSVQHAELGGVIGWHEAMVGPRLDAKRNETVGKGQHRVVDDGQVLLRRGHWLGCVRAFSAGIKRQARRDRDPLVPQVKIDGCSVEILQIRIYEFAQHGIAWPDGCDRRWLRQRRNPRTSARQPTSGRPGSRRSGRSAGTRVALPMADSRRSSNARHTSAPKLQRSTRTAVPGERTSSALRMLLRSNAFCSDS